MIYTRCLEFHMVHDPDTQKVRLTMVALLGDGRKVRYEGEGVYSRIDDEPRAELNMQREPIEVPFGDVSRYFVPGPPTATASCKVGELDITTPIVRTLIPPDSPDAAVVDLVETPEVDRGQ